MNEQTGKPKQPDAPTSLIKKAEEIKTLGYRVQTFGEIKEALNKMDKITDIRIDMETPEGRNYGDSISISDREIIHLFLNLLSDALAEAEPVIRAIHTPPRLFKLSGQENKQNPESE